MKPARHILGSFVASLGLGLLIVAIFFLLAAPLCRAAGLTIVTHGYKTGDSTPDRGWVDAMANYVADRAGEGAAVYKLVVGRDQNGVVNVTAFTKERGDPPSSYWNKPAEAVIKLHWDSVAGLEPVGFETTADIVAARAFEFLLNPPASAGFDYPLLELPILEGCFAAEPASNP